MKAGNRKSSGFTFTFEIESHCTAALNNKAATFPAESCVCVLHHFTLKTPDSWWPHDHGARAIDG